MATVHYGRLLGPVGFSRTVTIKRLHPQFAKDPEFVAMFLDEARLAARIQHPNVVSTLDVVALEGELLLVLEYVYGEALSQLLRAARRAQQAPPLRIVAAVAKAAGRVASSREGQLKGKLAYMSPEQVHTGVVDRRTDVYAASIVVREVLTGRRLFDGDNEGLLFSQVSSGTMTRPGELVPDLPPELDAIVMRGLAREPSDRYATDWDMAVALEEAIGLASPRQVGEWVTAIAGDRLEERRRRVTEIESISTLDFVPVGKSSQRSPSRDSAVLVAAPREDTVSSASLPTVAQVLVPATASPQPVIRSSRRPSRQYPSRSRLLRLPRPLPSQQR